MASLRTLPTSKNFIACFTDMTGRRLQRSTGTHIRKDALKVAEQYEEAARKFKTEAQIRKVLSDLYGQMSGTPLRSGSIRLFFGEWLGTKASEISTRTSGRYHATVKLFLEHLGGRADLELGYLAPADILGFRGALSKRLGGSSVNVHLNVLRAAMSSAVRAGLIPSDPSVQVEGLKREKSGVTRRAFTMEELQRILAVADVEWRGLIAFGLYTGQRLGDLAALTWGNLDLARYEIRLVTGKTGRQMILPLVRPLQPFLNALGLSRDAHAPLFAAAHRTLTKAGAVSPLSNHFHSLLVAAGLAPKRSKSTTGLGRAGRRQKSEISFHALRHTATSLLKNAGVSDVVAREFVGHDSTAVSKHYTHIETETLRQAAEKMPVLFNGK